MKGVGGTPTGVSAWPAGASDQWRRLAALQARPVPGFNPVAPRWRRAEREATRTRSVPRGHDSAPPAHQNGECAPCWIQPAPCRESPPHPSTRSQRRHPNSHGPRTRPARAPEEAAPERGSVGAGRARRGARVAAPQAPEAPLSWRLEPSLAQARPWARERPAVAFLHAGVALFHARLAFLEHGRDLAALGVIQAVPDCQPLIAGLLHLGVELTAVLFGLRDQRARVELAAVQLRLEQVMALAPAARMASRRPRWLSWAVLTSACCLSSSFSCSSCFLDTGPRPGK